MWPGPPTGQSRPTPGSPSLNDAKDAAVTVPGADWAAARVALDLLGPKWVPAMLVVLAAGPRRPADIRRQVDPEITNKVLSWTLRRMTAAGLITRRVVDDGQRPAVLYTLTPDGRALLEVTTAAAHWTRTRPAVPDRPTLRPATGPGRAQ